MNVLSSRSKAGLVVIGNPQSFKSRPGYVREPDLVDFINMCETKGTIIDIDLSKNETIKQQILTQLHQLALSKPEAFYRVS